MRIACTACNAVYELPPDRVRPGRGVKCARCGGVWVPVELEDAAPEIQPVPELAPLPEAVPEPIPEPVPPAPEPEAVVAPAPMAPARAPSRVPMLAAWVASLLILAGAAWAAVSQREGIMHAWPPSERAYRLIGMDGGKRLAP